MYLALFAEVLIHDRLSNRLDDISEMTNLETSRKRVDKINEGFVRFGILPKIDNFLGDDEDCGKRTDVGMAQLMWKTISFRALVVLKNDGVHIGWEFTYGIGEIGRLHGMQ